MGVVPLEYDDLYDDVADLQAESLEAIATSATAIGFVWITLLIGPAVFETAPLAAWIGGFLLAVSGYVSLKLKDHFLSVAVYLLVLGIFGATALAVVSLASPMFMHLFTVPVVVASVLLNQQSFFLVPVAASILSLVIGLAQANTLQESGTALFSTAIIVLVTLASRLSTRNLYTTLEWVWRGYAQARHNEELARDRQAQLSRALKALDDAAHRLARTNYTLALARDEATKARQLKQRFAQTVSHELRTPINVIVGFIGLMIHSPENYGSQLPPAYLRDLSIVYRNASHLQTLIDDVLDLARIDAAQMSIVPQECDPSTLVREVVNTARGLVEARGLALHSVIESQLPLLWIDPTRIRQVLLNLLNNAARFTEKGQVTVSVHHQGDEVVFTVADTGEGIAPEDISSIFEEFLQVGRSTRRLQAGGAGLGLAISKRFVESHGGRIWVESQVGRGSVFSFALPVPDSETPDILDESLVKTVPEGSMPGKGSEQSILLVVTRSPSSSALLARHVKGCRTVVAVDLEQARELAQQLMPQTVIIDSMCTPLDQSELQGLGHAWGLPSRPFILCPLRGEELLARRLDVEGYLVKPVSYQDLWDVLRQFGEDVNRVLIVDDDRDFALLLARMLGDSPIRRYQVVSAGSGREGLAMMHQYPPDLVLLDLIMPDIDGFEFIERVRSTSEWHDIPIVVISAQDEIDDTVTLTGPVSISRANGLVPSDVVKWIQCVMSS